MSVEHFNGIRVIINPYLPPNTISVSPELFEQMKAANEGKLAELQKQRDVLLERCMELLRLNVGLAIPQRGCDEKA